MDSIIVGMGQEQITESYWPDVDPTEPLHDDPTFAPLGGFYPVGPIALYSDRKGGVHEPVFRNEMDLQLLRGHARVMRDAFPPCVGALDSLADYTIGDGFVHEVVERDGVTCPDGLLQHAQWILDENFERNDWRGDRERELYLDAKTDGDYTLLFYDRKGSPFVQMRKAWPEQVTEPGDPHAVHRMLKAKGAALPDVSSYTFGVHTDADDPERVYGYHLKWDESGDDWTYHPSTHAEMIKLNVNRATKRGITDCYAVMGDLIREAKLRRNMAEGAAIQAAIAWVLEAAPGTLQAGGRFGDHNTANRETSRRQPNGREQSVLRYGPGSIIQTKSGQVYKPGPMGHERNSGFEVVSQMLMRAIGLRWRMPEYLISGDASNSNLASSLIAEAPFVKARETEQRLWTSMFRRIDWKLLHLAARAGAFEKWNIVTGSQLRRWVKLEITPPAVATRNATEQVTVDEKLIGLGVKSRETSQLEWGLDPKVEAERGAAPATGAPLPGGPAPVGEQSDSTVSSRATEAAFIEGMAAEAGLLEGEHEEQVRGIVGRLVDHLREG